MNDPSLSSGNTHARVLVFGQEQALQCWKGQFAGQERLFLSPAELLIEDGRLRLRATARQDLWGKIYPPVDEKRITGEGISIESDGIFTHCTATAQEKSMLITAQRVKDAGVAREVPIGGAGVAQAPEEADFAQAEVWQISFPADALECVCDGFLRVTWVGDAARAYIGDRLIADDFSFGQHPGRGSTWEIALRRFAPDVLEQGLQLRFLPLREDAPVYLDPEARPVFQEGKVLKVHSISAHPLYEAEVHFK
jgi:beta-galactosidase